MAFLLKHPAAARAWEPVDSVNPNLGTLSFKTWSTSPTVQLPHGMLTIDPVTNPGIGDKYLADKIYGFSLGASMLMARVGDPAVDPSANASEFDHDQEIATPYYYSVLLEDYGIIASYTTSEHAAYYRFAIPAAESAHVLLYLSSDAEFKILGNTVVEGSQVSRHARTYFWAEFNRPWQSLHTWKDRPGVKSDHGQMIGSTGLVLNYPAAEPQVIEVRVGVSFISTAQAHQNLQHEIPDWDFERVCLSGRQAWNEAIGRIRIEGGTEEQKTMFYTALYRTLGWMKNITEYGKYYSGFDQEIHTDQGRDFYTCEQPWDTYRCARPLQAILEPEHFVDFLQSYVRMYEHSGWIPNTPDIGGDFATMVGRHITAIIVDGYNKGFRNFDVIKAYEGLLKNALERTMLPWTIGSITELDRHYFEKGYYPALPAREELKGIDLETWRGTLWAIIGSRMPYQITWLPEVGVEEWVKQVNPWHRRQSVSVTLENAYDDWCLAQLAQALGKTDDFNLFMGRAGNYRNLFNPQTGFMSPKTVEGEWVEPFDPILSGGFAGEAYFAEMNAWTYTFHVQHDVKGLVDLMGGRAAFVRKLNALFTEQYIMDKPAFWGQFPDSSGLIGQYAQGNEPSFHIPYLYNYAGAPWRTQRRVRDIMKIWYNAGPMGLPGDDDDGAMSAWFAFSAMGFYPVCPGRPIYDIGSPIFEKVTIDTGGGRAFTILARNVSDQNKYIQSAVLNAQPLNRPWFEHTDLSRGGTLEFIMGPRPEPNWGSAIEAAPPSMTG